jgi:UDP-2,3-diacylglucosamine hydrolase
MALYIFSDVHLGSGSDELEALKVRRIGELFELVRNDGDRLIILGDLFDFWFEYKHAIPKEHTDTLFMLRDLVKHGIAVDYVSGNHDFWMGDYFEKNIGVHLHQDKLDLEYAGFRLHLLHGDGLARADHAYRLLKRILRNRFNFWLYRKLPPDWAIPFAKAVSRRSRGYNSRRDHTFLPEYEKYAARRLSEGYDIVVIGHLHVPVFKSLDGGTYINTGDFIHHFSYARVDEQGATLRYLGEQPTVGQPTTESKD